MERIFFNNHQSVLPEQKHFRAKPPNKLTFTVGFFVCFCCCCLYTLLVSQVLIITPICINRWEWWYREGCCWDGVHEMDGRMDTHFCSSIIFFLIIHILCTKVIFIRRAGSKEMFCKINKEIKFIYKKVTNKIKNVVCLLLRSTKLDIYTERHH